MDFRRKRNRLEHYDYSDPGAYFITFCVSRGRCILCADDAVTLTAAGQCVQKHLTRIDAAYPGVHVAKYVIMPNHIHMILEIQESEPTVTISRIIKQTKGLVTKELGREIFQRSFHDHVIRNEKTYLEIWNYIENNPAKWQEDCFHPSKWLNNSPKTTSNPR